MFTNRLISPSLLPPDQIPSYLAPFKYLSFYRYCLQNLLALDLEGRVFNCYTPEQMAASGQVSRKGGREGGRRADLLCYLVVEAFVALCPATGTSCQ